MNGSRLSDDAALMRGFDWLQRQATGQPLDGDDAERALAMIAMRYPEEAGQLREFWQTGQSAALGSLLGQLQQQFREDSQDDD